MLRNLHHVMCAAPVLVVISSLHAATLHVPADYPTIQSCIDASVSGQDECVVAPGTYHELINFIGKAITVRSANGADVTTIDGTGLNGSVVTCAESEKSTTSISGFTITGGSGTQLDINKLGGGMYNNSTSPTISDCIFTANSADAGGAIYNWFGNSIIVRTAIRRNVAHGCGGGIANVGGAPSISSCLFHSNTTNGSVGYGGGMYNDQSSPWIRSCEFTSNTANNGGAIYSQYGQATISECIFSSNSARSGGALLNVYWSNPNLSNCVFIGNTSSHGSGGGMVISSHSNPALSNCSFVENGASFGGGGGLSVIFDSNPTVANCTFWGDSSIYIESSAPNFRNNVLQGPFPSGALDGGGNLDLDPLFVRDPFDGGDGWGDNPSTTGIDESANDDYGDLRLQSGSPCINAGDPNFVPQPGETDLDGHARVLCGRVDIGAYEFGIGDNDCNQVVNLSDFAAWSGCATGPRGAQSPPYAPGCEAFDFNANGNIDLADFAQFELTVAP